MMGVRGLVAAMAGAGMLAACSTAEPYGGTPLKAVAALDGSAGAPRIRVGPDGPMMTENELQAERLRRMHDRIRTNPGLGGKVDDDTRSDGDYVDVLRR